MNDAHDPHAVPDSLLGTLALPRLKAMIAVLLALAMLLLAVLMTRPHPAAAAPLALALAWAAMIDIDRFRLPDILTLPMIAGGLLYAWLMQDPRMVDYVIGAVAGYLSLVIVAEVFRRLRGKDGLGRGDAKLLAAAGAWIGWAALPSVVFIAAVTGLAFALVRRVTRDAANHAAAHLIPFGPFLATGFWLVLLAGWHSPLSLHLIE